MLVLGEGKYTGDTLGRMDVGGSIVSAVHYPEGQCNPDWHCHENLHISYVFQDGEPTCATDGVYFYHAGQEHRWEPSIPIARSVTFEARPEFLSASGSDAIQIEQAVRENPGVKALLLRVHQELLIQDQDSSQCIQSLLLALTSFALPGRTTPSWVAVVAAVLQDRWNEPVTLEELSIAAAVHPVTISKQFSRYFGCTLSTYRRRARIDRCIPLVKNSGRPLTEIALHAGFADQSHFTRTFKSLTGFLPRDFRSL